MSGEGPNDVSTACEEAIERGCYVITPGVREVFVDIDTEEQHKNFKECARILDPLINHWEERKSPSGEAHHFHIVVTLYRELTDEQRVMFQALLASDPVREALTFMRTEAKESYPNLLFEKDDTVLVKAFASTYELGGAEAAIALVKEYKRTHVSEDEAFALGD